jgi:tight adherence protein B
MGLSATQVFSALLVGLGLAAAVVGVLVRAQRRSESLADLLDLVGGEYDVPVEAVTESPAAPSVSKVTARLGDLLGRLDSRGALERSLAQAGLPLRPGEFLFLAGVAATIAGLLSGLLTGSPFVAVPVFLAVAWGGRLYLFRRGHKRREQLRTQLPDAFSLIASAVASGHTFLRAIQLLREQIAEPLAGELERVVAEVMLGSNLIDGLERMALRSQIDELRWAVQAVRIQQTTGGQLSELLHTLADFMRTREEVHREVMVLSAEGRISAWVLLSLPFVVAILMEAQAPNYLRPFFRGWGFAWMGICAFLLGVGFLVIRRMIEIEV